MSADPVTPTPKHWRITCVALTVVVAVVHLYVWKDALPLGADGRRDYGAIRFHDEQNYYVHCAERVAEKGLSYLSEEDSLRSPPVPWLWLLLLGRSIVLARAANIGLVIFASWMLGAIARDRWGRSTQLFAFIAAALGYQVVQYSATVLTEPLSYSLVCAALWAAHRFDRSRRLRDALLLGIAIGAASLARPSLQLWPFAMVGIWALKWACARWSRRVAEEPAITRLHSAGELSAEKSHSVRLLDVIAIVAAYLVVLAPWLIKNVACFGVPRIANGFGAVFYLGSELRTDGDEPIFSGMEWPNHAVQGSGGHMSLDGEQRLIGAAKQNIREHPDAWLRLAVVKAERMLIGGAKWHFFPSNTLRGAVHAHGRGEAIVVFIWWTLLGSIVTVTGMAGLVGGFRKGGLLFVTASALVVYFVLLHSATFALPRFAVPLWPAFVLGACAMLRRDASRWPLIVTMLIGIGTAVFIAQGGFHSNPIEVDSGRVGYFTITGDAEWNEADGTSITLDMDGQPLFNTCVFVTVALEPRGKNESITGRLLLKRAGDAEFDLSSAIEFPMRADGTNRTYLLCVELNKPWKQRDWDAIRWEFDPVDRAMIRHLRIRVGH